MYPRKEIERNKGSYVIDEKNYERFPVNRQAFVKVSYQDTGEISYLGCLQKMMENSGKNMQLGRNGYTQLDYALDMGANTLNLMVGSYGFPNNQFLKWQPLFIDNALTKNKLNLPTEELTERVKGAAKLYGSDLTGVAPLDKRWVYSHDMAKPFIITDEGEPKEADEGFYIPKSVNNAIVLAFVMEPQLQEKSPEISASVAATLGYSRMAITAVSLAEYIRALGYTAIPCMNDTALSIPLAIDAGLGQLGRHGLLITPEYGSNVRLCKVLTDMPLIPDKPIDFGITEFCDNCLICAKECPSGSISTGERTFQSDYDTSNSGALKWYINGESCLRFWQVNGGSCANCISSCPFTYGFEFINCFECEKCQINKGSCPLQENTTLRIKHGYLDASDLSGRAKVKIPVRPGL